MTDPLSAAAAIARIPDVEPAKARYRALGGGFSNRSWLVEVEERKLVLRLDTPHAAALGLDRETELAVLREAGEAGLAPEVVFADLDAGLLVYEYLPGRSWTADDLAEPANLEALSVLLRKVHALPRSGVVFDPAGAARRYTAILRGSADLGGFAPRCLEIISKMPPTSGIACCHNDLVAANILATPDLRLLDWEYACDNDPLFDLASLIGYHDLTGAQTEALLSAYGGGSGPELASRLRINLRLFDALYWLWLAVVHSADPRPAHRRRLDQLARRLRRGPE